MNSLKDKCGVGVYVAALPDGECDSPLYPEERDRAVRETANSDVRRERYFVWKLLEYAIKESFGIPIESLRFEKRDGIWSAEGVEFSLSHSGGALAVAVSSAPVGVDIEPLCGAVRDGVAERFFNSNELRDYLAAAPMEREERFLRIWTAKEAIFKSRGEEAFLPLAVDSCTESVFTDVLSLGGVDCILSVYTAASLVPSVRIVDGVFW